MQQAYIQPPTRESTLFRIVVKGLGLYFVVYGIGSFLGTMANVLVTVSMMKDTPTDFARENLYRTIGYLLTPIFHVAVGSALLFAGRFVAGWFVSSKGRICLACGGELRGATGACPECGTATLQ